MTTLLLLQNLTQSCLLANIDKLLTCCFSVNASFLNNYLYIIRYKESFSTKFSTDNFNLSKIDSLLIHIHVDAGGCTVVGSYNNACVLSVIFLSRQCRASFTLAIASIGTASASLLSLSHDSASRTFISSTAKSLIRSCTTIYT